MKAVALLCMICVGYFSKVRGSISLGSCRLSCDENEENANPLLGVERLPGPPGKIGPRGPAGVIGPVGPKGEVGTCQCSRFNELLDEVNSLKLSVEELKQRSYIRDCKEAKKTNKTSGVVLIFPLIPSATNGIHVYCDQDTDGGGWIVIQRRVGSDVDFFRGWDEYVRGFGNKEEDFWLGLEAIHLLTDGNSCELRVDLEDTSSNKAFAKYRSFSLRGSNDNYRLLVSGYSGTAGDSLRGHNNKQFTTKDRDNDDGPANCATKYKSAWWYHVCHTSNLNGVYGASTSSASGVTWYHWKNRHESLKHADMKIRCTS